jgi:cell division protein FtsA
LSRDTFYTAIDIGTGKIASIVARVGTEGELKILGSGVVPSQGVQKGRIENINEVQTAIRASLDESQKYIARGVITGVYVSVSGTHLSCLNTKEAIANPEDVSDINAQLLHRLIQSSFPRVDRSQEILHIIPIAYDGPPGERRTESAGGGAVY